MQLVCDLEFGPTVSIELVAPHLNRAFVKFKYVAHAVRAMLVSLPTSEKGAGGVRFDGGKRFVFEPRKRTVLSLYREVGESEEGATDGPDSGRQRTRGENWDESPKDHRSGKERLADACATDNDQADYECAMYVQVTRAGTGVLSLTPESALTSDHSCFGIMCVIDTAAY